MSLDVYQRLLALSRARAVPAASRAHRHLSPRPWVLSGYHLAGEPSAPVAIRYGSFRDSPKLLTIAEPRDRKQRFAALGALARDLATYLSRYTVTEPVVRATGNGRELDVNHCCVDAPQLVVPNEATAHWTGLLGQYLRTLDDPVLQQAGAHLGWIASRRHLPGSSVLLTATDLLTTHWRTGQLPTEDGHLGRLLAWIEPPAGSDAWQAARDAEARPPAGPASDPAWDQVVLRPALERAKEQGDVRRLKIAATEVLDGAWRDTWAALDLVRLLPPGEHVARRWESDRWSWTRHRERVLAGTVSFTTRLADVPAYRYLHELETRTTALDRQMALDDPLVMARYLATGEAVAGTVVKRDPEHTITNAGGRSVLRPLLWVRPNAPFDRPAGTELWLGKLGMTVRAVTDDTVELMVVSGAVTRPKLNLLPEADAEVVLAPFGPQQHFPDNLPDELPWPARGHRRPAPEPEQDDELDTDATTDPATAAPQPRTSGAVPAARTAPAAETGAVASGMEAAE
ncbi:hypothetical protein CS0771_19610 [Catellatospora sp. IY07-71]|uniref:hypothetical protein n=1 Tax=Catellatospora sp. IY07-71 TaxID=2728827 RepID=UPI001BB3F94D|nr:hypothetical protein [Catellatospora sp. IY07-71]BCJ72417.1 hypothetical protein CS0771_19610 [Catellatospora sp. IY07-71]